jgi:hypothetical protein
LRIYASGSDSGSEGAAGEEEVKDERAADEDLLSLSLEDLLVQEEEAECRQQAAQEAKNEEAKVEVTQTQLDRLLAEKRELKELKDSDTD